MRKDDIGLAGINQVRRGKKMSSKWTKIFSFLLVLILIAAVFSSACSDEDDETGGEKTVIKFALDLPLSGAAATAFIPTKIQSEAFIRYINAEEPIPGVELEVITYDNQYDPSEAIPSYLDLVDRGAKFIAWADSTCATNIQSVTTEDKFLVFAGNGTEAILEDPGYTFCCSMPFAYCTEGFMRWLEDDWSDYPTKPKVGCFGWNMSFGIDHATGAEDYADAHPDKFDWVGTELAPYGTASWATEVEKLKDCDYIVIGAFAGGAASFINEFSGKGYDTIFVHSDPVMGFWNSVTLPTCGSEELDGDIWSCMARYYRTDPGEIGDIITDKLIPTYCTAEEAEAFQNTAPYSCVANLCNDYFVVEVIREAVSNLEDPADLTSEIMYDTIFSEDFDFELEGYPDFTYTKESPVMMRWTRIYEYSATLGDFERASDWILW